MTSGLVAACTVVNLISYVVTIHLMNKRLDLLKRRMDALEKGSLSKWVQELSEGGQRE